MADGTVSGLRLHPGKDKGHGKWEMRFSSPDTHKRRDMGLGTYPEVSALVDVHEISALVGRSRASIWRDAHDTADARTPPSCKCDNALTPPPASR